MVTALYDEMEEPTPHVAANFKSLNYTLGMHVLYSLSDVLYFPVTNLYWNVVLEPCFPEAILYSVFMTSIFRSFSGKCIRNSP
jgi:hypothetical protein